MQLEAYAAILRAKAEIEYIDRLFRAAFAADEDAGEDCDLYRETPTTSPFLDMVPRSQSSHSDKTAASGSENTPPAPQHPETHTGKPTATFDVKDLIADRLPPGARIEDVQLSPPGFGFRRLNVVFSLPTESEKP